MLKRLNSDIYVYGIPALLLVFLVVLTQTALFSSTASDLSWVITLDLLITIPFIYFLLIRKKEIPKFTVVSVFIIGIIVASWILPTQHQGLLAWVKTFILPLIELAIIGYLILQTKAIIKSFRTDKTTESDFYDALISACTQVLPNRIGRVLATEIAVFYYAFKPRKKQAPRHNEYTYFEKSGIKTTILVFVFLIILETGIMHLLIQQWSSTAAWILTLLGLYTCLQIVALLRSMNERLISIDETNGQLHLRYGFFNHTSIPLEQIESIEYNKKTLPSDNSVIAFSPLDLLDTHNIILHLREEQLLHKIYSLWKNYTALAIYVDEKEEFIQTLQKLLSSNEDQ